MSRVGLVDAHVGLLGLGQHRDGGRAGVDPALGLGDRHPLDPVDAASCLRRVHTDGPDTSPVASL